jgi:GNAT superfamily N-acetyltransferase
VSAPSGPLTRPAPLGQEHDLTRFSCGRPELDAWLRDHALDSEGRSARTYVVCTGRGTVVGYYCIATGSVELRALPSKMKRARGLPKQIPVAIIGRLARDETFRGTGLGRDLLQDALRRILAAAQIIGIRAVLVHALDEDAAAFWRSQDFIASPVGSGTFFLPLETIAGAL